MHSRFYLALMAVDELQRCAIGSVLVRCLNVTFLVQVLLYNVYEVSIHYNVCVWCIGSVPSIEANVIGSNIIPGTYFPMFDSIWYR